MRNNQRLIILLCLLCFAIDSLQAQQVVATSGNILQNGSGSVSYTLGELIIDTKTSKDITLTQGFQQPNLTVTLIEQQKFSNIELSAFPNPTAGLVLLIANEELSKANVQIFDDNGKLILQNTMTGKNFELDFTIFKNGTYLLKVISANSQFISIYKIVKQ
jgi:hypothetical protein